MQKNGTLGWLALSLVLALSRIATGAGAWQPHEIRQINGTAGEVRLPAQFQIVTESWKRVVAAPYLAYVKVYNKKWGLSVGLPADAPAQTTRPAIYDEAADGAKQVEEALAKAKKENKHVLLMFGANWCGWCHRLHTLFDSNAQISAKLKQDFVLVMIDVNKNRNADVNQRYGKPTRFGLPVLVVLDAEGKALTTQDTGKLEEGDHHDPAKVLAFLNQWAPSRRSS